MPSNLMEIGPKQPRTIWKRKSQGEKRTSIWIPAQLQPLYYICQMANDPKYRLPEVMASFL